MRVHEQLLYPPPRRRWFAWLVAAALLVATVYVGIQVASEAEEAMKRQAALETARARLVRKPAPLPSRAKLEEQKRWDALANERAFSWYPVFRALEQASSADIELLEFVPDKSNRRLTLRGEARSMAALTSYLGALAAQDALTEAHLARQKNLSRGGMSLVSFEIKARIN